MRPLVVGCLLALLASACGDDATVPTDAGPRPDGPDRPDAGMPMFDVMPPALPAAPAEPIAPALPVLTPCPTGWREVTTDDLVTCDPWPGTGYDDGCAPHEAHFPGEPGCTTVGDACPAAPAEFPSGFPSGATVLHVRAGATGGDGSETRPHGTLAAALSAASAGDFIAVAAGTYGDRVVTADGVTVVGVCAERVIFTASLNHRAGTLTVRNVSLTTGQGIVTDGAGTTLALEGVVIDGVFDWGALIDTGSTFTAREVVFRDIVARPVPDTFSRAFNVQVGSSAEIRRAVFERALDIGVFASSGATLLLEDAAIRSTLPEEGTSTDGNGLFITAATATVNRVVIEDNREYGMWVNAGATVTADHVIVRDTMSQALDMFGGRGLAVVDAMTDVTATHLLVEDNLTMGIVAARGARLRLTDGVVRGQRSAEDDGEGGYGVLALSAGTDVSAQRLAVVDNRSVGVRADLAATVALRDLVVRATQQSTTPDIIDGQGLTTNEATLTVERALIADNAATGFQVYSMDGVGTLRDAVIERNPFAGASATQGRMTLERVRAEDNERLGLQAWNGATLDARDVQVLGTSPADGPFGYGLSVEPDATARVERAVFERNHVYSVIAFRRSDVTLVDVTARESLANASGLGGSAVVAIESDLTATRILSEGNRASGISLVNAVARVEDATIRDTIGIGTGQGGRAIEVAFLTGREVSRPSELTLARAAFANTPSAALAVSGAGCRATIEDVSIVDTLPRELDGKYGRAIAVQHGASVDVRRAFVSRSHDVGAFAIDGSTLTLAEVEIRDTDEQACAAAGSCTNGDGGTGLGAYQGSTIEATDFIVASSDLCGVLVGTNSTMDLLRGQVHDNAIGACVQVDGFDTARLMDEVRYYDNGVNLQATTLPVPDTVGSEPSMGIEAGGNGEQGGNTSP